MRNEMHIVGLPELEKTLTDAMPRSARNITNRTVVRVAALMRNDVRQRAPVGPTGNLKRSIKSRRNRGSRDVAEASVYVDRSGGRSGKGYHWHLLEFGTVKMAAQPFFRPAIEDMKGSLPRIYRTEFGAQFERELARRGRV